MAKIYQGRIKGTGEWKWYTAEQVAELGGALNIILAKTIPDAVKSDVLESVTISAPAELPKVVAEVTEAVDAVKSAVGIFKRGGRPRKAK